MFALSKRAEFNLCGFNEPAPFTFSQLRLAQRESKICRRDKVAQSGDDDGCLFSCGDGEKRGLAPNQMCQNHLTSNGSDIRTNSQIL